MGDSDFSTTHDPDAGVHEVTVPVKTGLNITVPAIPSAAPPAPADPDDFYDWPTWLVKAQRSPAQKIGITLADKEVDPVLSNEKNYDKEAPGGSVREFKPEDLQKIKERRANLDDSMLKLTKDGESGKFGWSFKGTPGTPTLHKDGTTGTLEHAHWAVWLELGSEGGYTAINAYDGAHITWGQGWAMTGGMQYLMNAIFKKPVKDGPDRTPIKKALLDLGIGWQSPGTLLVVNDDGYKETGTSAKEQNSAVILMQGTKRLLAALIAVGNEHMDLLVNTEFEVLQAAPAGQVPAFAYTGWSDDLIRLAAHINHMWPGQGWKYKTGDSIDEFLLAWGKGSWTKRDSGVYRPTTVLMISFLKIWGNGIGWKPFVNVSPTARPFSKKEIDDKVNTDLVTGLLAVSDLSETGFYFYPRLPLNVVFDDDLYNWVSHVGAYDIDSLLAEAEKLGTSRAKGFRTTYDTSTRTSDSYGYRPRVALDAAIAKKGSQAAHTALYADPNFKALPGTQQTAIKKYLGEKSALSEHDQIMSDIANHQGYEIKALIGYFRGKGYATVVKMRNWYASPDNPERGNWGPRPLIAMDAFLHANEGDSAKWILDQCAMNNLDSVQTAVIRTTIGMG